MVPLKVDTSGNVTSEGPPTPTHSETQDCIDARKCMSVANDKSVLSITGTNCARATPSPLVLSSFTVTSPGGTNPGVQGLSSLQSLSTLGSLGNLSNTGLQALSRVQPPLTPSLTPSLANHYREDLTQHVRAFPADILEKQVYMYTCLIRVIVEISGPYLIQNVSTIMAAQAQKLSEEAHTMGSLQCTRVSAELKTARSIVRLTEIQATLQEQRYFDEQMLPGCFRRSLCRIAN